MCQATCSLFHFLCVVVKSWFAKDCLNCSESGVHICTRHSPRLVIILPAIFSTVLTAVPSSRMAFSTLIAVDVPLPRHLSSSLTTHLAHSPHSRPRETSCRLTLLLRPLAPTMMPTLHPIAATSISCVGRDKNVSTRVHLGESKIRYVHPDA
jgi:hypothetical protein